MRSGPKHEVFLAALLQLARGPGCILNKGLSLIRGKQARSAVGHAFVQALVACDGVPEGLELWPGLVVPYALGDERHDEVGVDRVERCEEVEEGGQVLGRDRAVHEVECDLRLEIVLRRDAAAQADEMERLLHAEDLGDADREAAAPGVAGEAAGDLPGKLACLVDAADAEVDKVEPVQDDLHTVGHWLGRRVAGVKDEFAGLVDFLEFAVGALGVDEEDRKRVVFVDDSTRVTVLQFDADLDKSHCCRVSGKM